jgi:LysM repeat protein
MAKRRRRTPARWLAPLALVTCAVAVYAVVDNTINDDSSPQGTTTTRTTTKAKTTSTSAKRKRKRTYIVKSGDTLSAISVKTGVPLSTLEQLNPKLDADTLHTGQKVRLSR